MTTRVQKSFSTSSRNSSSSRNSIIHKNSPLSCLLIVTALLILINNIAWSTRTSHDEIHLIGSQEVKTTKTTAGTGTTTTTMMMKQSQRIWQPFQQEQQNNSSSSSSHYFVDDDLVFLETTATLGKKSSVASKQEASSGAGVIPLIVPFRRNSKFGKLKASPMLQFEKEESLLLQLSQEEDEDSRTGAVTTTQLAMNATMKTTATNGNETR